MKLIVITSENIIERETEKVIWLLENGATRIHLRKPDWTERQVKKWLESIPMDYLPKITIHNKVELAKQIGVGGIHGNRNISESDLNTIQRTVKRSLLISHSCHSIEELREKDKWDYCFLSPIFDSVSKKGYKRAFDDKSLEYARAEGLIDEKVIALGGITAENIRMVRNWGFGGVAMIGAVWNQSENDEVFKQNWQRICQEIRN